jgi:hypothetical protein
VSDGTAVGESLGRQKRIRRLADRRHLRYLPRVPPETAALPFPTPLDAYGPPSPGGIVATLLERATADPLAAAATGVFLVAILHTFVAAKFTWLAHDVQHRADRDARQAGRAHHPAFFAEVLHFFGEVEVVFGLWVVALLALITSFHDWSTAVHYLNDTVNFTEPLFVVVIMALSATRPIVSLAERWLSRVASFGGGTPAAWWASILTLGPLMGSFITEPAAMTISALLLSRQFYDLSPSLRLRLATIGLLFVNVSIGGTLTHFAAPPVLMVARPWGWDTAFMLSHFGWRSIVAIVISNAVYFVAFRAELTTLARRPTVPDLDRPLDRPDEEAPAGSPTSPIPSWITLVHVAFLTWTVVNVHYPALFIGGFLFFLGFVKATAPYQGQLSLRSPLLVGFFLAGLVIHGGLQAWWIAPVLASLSEEPLFLGATVLTAFNDNALITYLATLVPNLSDSLKVAVVEGAVTGGGLTLIANAPNPAGHAILARFFGGAVPPAGLALAALPPTIVAIIAFRLL